jgi:alpha-tubulin suppressor-like RCC1 family protein
VSDQAAWAVGGIGFVFGNSPEGVHRSAAPVDTTNLGDLRLLQVDVASSDRNGMVLAEDGRVFASGGNEDGELGLGTTSSNVSVLTPIDTTNLGGRRIRQVATNGVNSLLLAEDGSLFSFGNGTLIATPVDSTFLGGRKVTQISVGGPAFFGGLNLLLADDGNVFSFDNVTSIATPIDSTNLGGRKITQMSAGWNHNLLLAEDGTAFSFGSNGGGRTGLGTSIGETLIATPIDTSNLGGLKITQVAAGREHSLVLAEDGRVLSFGANVYGKTGLATNTGETLVATPIDTTHLGSLQVTQIAAGNDHSLVLTDDGRVFSFGHGGSGLTGYGTPTSSQVALPIDRTNLMGMRVTQISAGTYYSLIIAEPRLQGDYNENGVVDAADYVVWRKTLGQIVAPGTGADGNGNGEINQLDYLYWRERFGISAGSATTSLASREGTVPEPACLLLLTIAAMLAGSLCCRGKH